MRACEGETVYSCTVNAASVADTAAQLIKGWQTSFEIIPTTPVSCWGQNACFKKGCMPEGEIFIVFNFHTFQADKTVVPKSVMVNA